MRKTIKTMAFVLSMVMILSSFGFMSVFADAENVTRPGYTAYTRNGLNLYLFDNVDQTVSNTDAKFGPTGSDLIRVAGAGQYKQYKDGYGMIIDGTTGDSNAPTWGFRIRKTQQGFALGSYFSIRYKVVGATSASLGVRTVEDGLYAANATEYSIDYKIENNKWLTATVQASTSNYQGMVWPTGGQGGSYVFVVNLPALNAGAYYVIDYCGEFQTTEKIALQEAASDAFWATIEPQPEPEPEPEAPSATELSARTFTANTLYFDGYDGSTATGDTNDDADYDTASGISVNGVADGSTYAKYNDGNNYLRVNNNTRRPWHFLFDVPSTFNASTAGNDIYLSFRYMVVGATETNNTTATFTCRTNQYVGTRTNTAIFDGALVNNEWQTVTVDLSKDSNYADGSRETNVFDPGRTCGIILPALDTGYYVVDYICVGTKTTVDNAAAEAEAFYDKYKVVNDDGIIFAGAQAKTGEKGVRFVGTVDNYLNKNYDEFGFVLAANGVPANKDAKATKVYKSIVANNDVVTPELFNSANKDGCTFFTFCLDGIDKDYTFTVSVYAIIDGEKIVGQSYTYQYIYETGAVVAA